MITDRKALLIGITAYPGKPLKYCIDDCDAMEEVLREHGNHDTNFDVQKLDKCTDARTAYNAIQKLFESDNVSTALFYFSGHGQIDTNNNGEIIFPDNCDQKNVYWGIKMDDLMKIVSKSKIKNKIIILDCCNSGAIANRNSYSNEASLPEGCAILASCLSNQTALESSESKHGIFTGLLIQALQGDGADFFGRVTIGGIYEYIDLCLGAWEQRPVFKSNVATFVPIRRVEPRVSREKMIKGLRLFKDPNVDFPLDPEYEPSTYPNPEEAKKLPKCASFRLLQEFVTIGFVEPAKEQLPEGQQHMYYAALFSKSCRLTPLGKNYWNLLNKNELR